MVELVEVESGRQTGLKGLERRIAWVSDARHDSVLLF